MKYHFLTKNNIYIHCEIFLINYIDDIDENKLCKNLYNNIWLF